MTKPKVKICGLSRQEDIDAVNSVLPDYVGFVFAQSKRQVNAVQAAALKDRLDPQIEVVGVFVNERPETVAGICRNGIIDITQLHGDEDDAYINRLKELCGCPVIKAIGIGDSFPPKNEIPKTQDYCLFDTLSINRGGTGKPFDWNILKGYDGMPFFLAGGLDINNAAMAIGTLSPFCVDVSSGVETGGIKDADKIRQFVAEVRNLNQ